MPMSISANSIVEMESGKSDQYKYIDYGDTKYEYIDYVSTVTIVKCISTSKNITIPDRINGVKVTEIKEVYPFIGVFENKSIETVSLPDTLYYIDSGIFKGCKNLKNISISKENECYTTIDGNLYSKIEEKELIQYCSGKESNSFVVPEGVEIIKPYAFQDSHLTTITFPNSLKEIYTSNFDNYPNDEELSKSQLKEVYYNGNSLDWMMLDISDDNDALSKATIHYDTITNLPKVKASMNEKYYVAYRAYDNWKTLKLCTFDLSSKIKKENRKIVNGCLQRYGKNFTYYTYNENHWEKDNEQPEQLIINIYEYVAYPVIQSNIPVFEWTARQQCYQLFEATAENCLISTENTTIETPEEPESPQKFVLGKDNNKYVHSNSKDFTQAGFVGIKNYNIDKSYYDKLIKGRKNTEIKYLQKEIQKSWSGSCFGISATMGLLHNGNIKSQDISSCSDKKYNELQLPYKDKKFLNNIQYYYLLQNFGYSSNKGLEITSSYCLGWFRRCINFFTDWIDDDSESECLEKIVDTVTDTALDYKTYIFTYQTEEGAHAVLITDVNYDESKGEYVFTVYDENAVNNEETRGSFGTLKISDDYEKFTYDCCGERFSDENYINIKLFDLDKIQEAAQSPSKYKIKGQGETNTTIRLTINNDIKIANENGEYVQIKDSSIDTNADIKDIYTYIEGNQSKLLLRVTGKKFTISEMDKACDITISDNTTFSSIEGNNIKTAQVSLEDKKITCAGNNKEKYNFKITCSTDNIINNNTKETGLISISGTANSKATADVTNDSLTVTSNTGISNVQSTNYTGVDIEQKSLTSENRAINKATVVAKSPKKNISKSSINKIKSYTYTGKSLKPKVIVKYGKAILQNNKDYKLYYYNNKNAGTARIVIKGINNYEGTKTLYFTIKKSNPVLKFKKTSVTIKKTKKRKQYTNKLTRKTDGKIKYYSSNKKVATVNSKGKLTIKKKGKAVITAVASAGKNYNYKKVKYKLIIK